MMKQAELSAAIDDMIEDRLDTGEPAAMSWLVREYAMLHPAPEGPHRELHELCMWEHVRDTVRERLRALRATEPTEQLHMEGSGFTHLQRRYTIDVGEDEQMVIPLEKMTPAHLRGKAKELRRMALGCMAHADELDGRAAMLESQPSQSPLA